MSLLIKQIGILIFLNNESSLSTLLPIKWSILPSRSLKGSETSIFNTLIGMIEFASTMAFLISTLASTMTLLLSFSLSET